MSSNGQMAVPPFAGWKYVLKVLSGLQSLVPVFQEYANAADVAREQLSLWVEKRS
jgi:hypothetical protein